MYSQTAKSRDSDVTFTPATEACFRLLIPTFTHSKRKHPSVTGVFFCLLRGRDSNPRLEVMLTTIPFGTFSVCGLDYAFTHLGCLPSSLYTFLALASIEVNTRLGSALPFILSDVRVSPNLADNLPQNCFCGRPNCSSLPRYLSSTPLY